MSEQIIQHGSIKNMSHKIGNWDYYILGATNLDHLVQHKVIQNKDYLHLSKKKPDNILVSSNQKVLVVVETKIPSAFKSEKSQQKAIDQEIEVAKILGAKLYIATDSAKSIWINPQTGNPVLDENGNKIIFTRNHLDPKIESLLIKIFDSISDHNDQIKPKELVDPSNLAKSIRQDIWSVSGATPENCLYTFVELFIFKYLSDLGILQSVNSFSFLMEMYKNDSPEEVLEYYANTIRKKIKILFPEAQSDHTTIINGTIFVSKDDKAVEGYSTVFKKVLEKFRDYGELKYIDHDFKSKLFESFLKESISKKNRGQYFTPLKVVRAIIKMADIKEGMKIGDPACGVGKFLLETVLDNVDKFYEVKDGKLISKINLVGYDKGFDKDEQKTIILAKANMLIYFCDLIKEHKDDQNITQQFAELFNSTFTLKTNSILGTLRDPEPNTYDLILTNPPYVVNGSSNLKEEIRKAPGLESSYTVSSIGIEGLFIERIIKGLKPGGQAIVVVPDGFLIRQHDKHLRKYLLEQCYLDAIISLPLKTFFTTTKKTYILIITKKHDIQKEVQIDPVFTYLVSEVGETMDIYRFDTEINHLNEAVDMYNFYKSTNRGDRSKLLENALFNADLRCKLQDINLFNPEKERPVDRWWSNEEKITLGIQDEENVATLQEFVEFIDETNNMMSEHKNLLQVEYSSGLTKNFPISELFNSLGIPKKIQRSDLQGDGKIPTYSSQIEEGGLMGYYKNAMFNCSVDNPLITFGDHTKAIYIRTQPFAVVDNVKVLELKTEYVGQIDINYIISYRKSLIPNLGYARHRKEAKKCVIPIPISTDGVPDIIKQQEIGEIYSTISQIKENLKEKLQNLKNMNITL